MMPITIKTETGLVDFLISRGYTKTKVRQLLKHRAISVNGRVVTAHDHHLSAGDVISLDARPKPGRDLLERYGIEIVYEDDAVMVIDKPAGLLTIATETEKRETAYYVMNAYLKMRDVPRPGRVFIVHRLDRETSGLLVFAKDDAAKQRLQKDWSSAEKRYYAVVEGMPKDREARIESYLSETATFKVYSEPAGDASKHAITRYKVLRTGKGRALLDLMLETGKKHQIRVHAADIGCPVVGDKKYGASTNPIRRLALHAYSLSFIHPVTRKRMHFAIPLPKSFAALVR